MAHYDPEKRIAHIGKQNEAKLALYPKMVDVLDRLDDWPVDPEMWIDDARDLLAKAQAIESGGYEAH